MQTQPIRRAVASLVSCALLIGLVPAMAAADPSSEPTSTQTAAPDDAPVDPQLQALLDAQAEQMAGVPTGGLTTIVSQRDSVRAGGSGSFDVVVPQTAAPGLTADDVRLSIKLGDDVKVTSAAGPGWECMTKDRAITCRSLESVSDSQPAEAIRVDLDGLAQLRDSQVAVKTTVTWKQRADAAFVAADKAWPAQFGDRNRVITRTVTNIHDVDAHGLLRITTRATGPDVHLIGPNGDIAVLEASLAGIERTKVTTTWRQLCATPAEAADSAACDGDAAPPVEFLALGNNSESDDWVLTNVRIPPLTKRTTFVFEVTASEGSAEIRARLRYVAEPFKAVSYNPRLETFTDLQAAVANQRKPGPMEGLSSAPLTAFITASGMDSLTVSKPARLTVVVPGHRVVRSRWTTAPSAGTTVKSERRVPAAISVTLPRDFRSTTVLIQAVATIENGETVQVDRVLSVKRALRVPRPTIEPRRTRFADTSNTNSDQVADSGSPAESLLAAGASDVQGEDLWGEDLWGEIMADNDDAGSGDADSDVWDDIFATCDENGDCPEIGDVLCTEYGWCDDGETGSSDPGSGPGTTTEPVDPNSYGMSKECTEDDFCFAMFACYGDPSNLNSNGDLTEDAATNSPSCAYLDAVIDEDIATDALPICEISSAMQDGKPYEIAFAGGGTLTLTKAAVPAGDCNEKATIDFTNEPLELAKQRFIMSGQITNEGVTFSGGSYLPPKAWAALGAGAKSAMKLTVSSDSAVGSKVKRAQNGKLEWTPLSLTVTLGDLGALVQLPGGWKWGKANLTVNVEGASITQAATRTEDGEAPSSADPEAKLVANVAADGTITGTLSLANVASFRDAAGNTQTVSGSGEITWKPKKDDEDEGKKDDTGSDASASATPSPSESPSAAPSTKARLPRADEPTASSSAPAPGSSAASASATPSPTESRKQDSQWKFKVIATVGGNRPIEIAKDLRMENVKVELASGGDGLTLSSDLRIGSVANAFIIKASGNFASGKNWSLKLAQDKAFTTPKPVVLKISDVKGELVQKKGILTFDLTAKASEWNPVPNLKDQVLSVRITNMCEKDPKAAAEVSDGSPVTDGASPSPSARTGAMPAPTAEPMPSTDPDRGAATAPTASSSPSASEDGKTKEDQKDKKCKKDAVRMEVEISGTVVLPIASDTGPTTDLEYRATAKFKFKPWEYTIVGGLNVKDGSIGPKELNLRNIQVTLTNAKVDSCMNPKLANPDKPLASPAAEPSASTTDAPAATASASASAGDAAAPALRAGEMSDSGSGAADAGSPPGAEASAADGPTASTSSSGTPTEDSPGTATQSSSPTPEPSESVKPAVTTFSLTADGTIWGQNVTFGGTFSKERICLVGTSSSDAKNPITQSMKVSGDLLFAYSSVDQDLILAKGEDGKPDRKTKLKAKSLAVIATVALPQDATKLGFSGNGQLSAVIGFSPLSIEGTVAAEFQEGINLLPATDANKLLLTQADLSVSAAATGVDLKASVRMKYVTVDGKPGTGIKASTTPLYATIGLKFGSSGAALKLAGGVDMANADSPSTDAQAAPKDAEIKNAFGQDGLIVRGLELELTIAANPLQSEIGFHGDVTLPDKWGSSIGLYPGAKIALAAKISITEPCLMLNISAGPGQEYAADMAKAGVMFTKELGLVIAPVGCTIGTKKIPAGFGFAFDATFGPKSSNRAQDKVKIIVGVTLPSESFKGLAIKADIDVPAWTLYDLKLERTIIKVDIDTTKKQYYVKVVGGLSLWGSFATVDMEIKADGEKGDLTARGKGALLVQFPGVRVDAKIDFNIVAKSFVVTTFQLDAEVKTRLLGIITIGVGATVNFDKGVLKMIEGRIHSLTSWRMTVKTDDGERISITDGWWVARYTTLPSDDPDKWRFAIGWRGKGNDSAGAPLDEKRLYELWVWTGQRNAEIDATPASRVVNGCEIKPRTKCRDKDLSGADLRGVDLSGADLRGVNVTGTNLSGANLRGAEVSWMKGDRANFAGANLTNAPFSRTTLTNADFTGASLAGADLSWATLDGSNFSGAKMGSSSIFASSMRNANLVGANLVGADLRRANLTNADLSSAKLTNADLWRADLTGAKWSDGRTCRRGSISVCR